MPAVRYHTALPLHAIQRWPRVVSMLGALFMATVLLSALFANVRAAPRVMEASTFVESAGTQNAGRLLVPPQQPAAVWTICNVDCDFVLIEEALADPTVADGDTLLVMNAVHTESGIFVTKDVTIRGQGAQETIVQAASTPPDLHSGGGGVFTIAAGTKATIADLTIRHGGNIGWQEVIAQAAADRDDGDAIAVAGVEAEQSYSGAGIAILGDLTLENSIVSDNFIGITSSIQAIATATAPITTTATAVAWTYINQLAAGAGITNSGNLTVTGSTIVNNEIYVQAISDAQVEAEASVITESAVATSTATIAGAGIYNEGNLWLSNSTVSGNRAHISSTAHAANEVDLSSINAFAEPASFSDEQPLVRSVRGSQNAFVFMETDANGSRVQTGSDEKAYSGALPGWLGAGEAAPSLTEDFNIISASIRSHAVAGIYNAGMATIHFSTISDNSAVTEADASGGAPIVITETVGGLFNEAGAELSLNSTIIASQEEGSDCSQTAGSSEGYNLDSDGSCALSGTGDQSSVDPLLAPLGDYGGSTPTHALPFGGPALDAADPSCPTDGSFTDQRGVSRPVEGDGIGDARCDIGAVEEVFEADLRLEDTVVGQTQIDGEPGNMLTETVDKVTTGARITYTFSVHNDGSDGAPMVLFQHTVPEDLEADEVHIAATQGTCDADLPADRSDPLHCELGNILSGEIVTVTVAGATAPSISDGAVLQSEASISSAAIDDEANNDGVHLITDVEARADVALTKTQTPAVAHPGEVVTYVVSIENQGPSDAPPVIVADILPNGLEDAAWTCTAQDGAACDEAGGSGSILQTIDLPAASAVIYTLTAQVSSCSTLENTASASETLDPYLENNGDMAVNGPYCVYLLPLLANQAATAQN